MLVDIAAGMSYLHARNVLHGERAALAAACTGLLSQLPLAACQRLSANTSLRLLPVSRSARACHLLCRTHRPTGDLKPGNVLIKYETGTPYGRTAKVADFGLAR